MRYLEAYQSLFKKPNWLMLLLAAIVCNVVPIVGPMVLMGFLVEGIVHMQRTRAEVFPDFDMNRLMPYLKRGVWPFLVTVIVGVPLGLLLGCCGGVCLFSSLGLGGEDYGLPMFIGALILFILFTVVVSLLVGMLTIPMQLQAGFRMEFGSAFNMEFVKDFFKRVGKECLLSMLFLVATGLVLGLIAACIPVVGSSIMGAVVGLAQWHLNYQLYTLYLERGGTPIPFKEEEPPTSPAT